MANSDEVIFMGASIIDLITYATRLPLAGETLCGKRFTKGFGGKAANQCVAAARLSLRRPKLICKLGDDEWGRETVKNYVAEGVNTEHVLVTKDDHSSVSTISVADDGQNSILYVPAAANLLSPGDIQLMASSFQQSVLFVSTCECLPDTLKSALRLARANAVTTIVNTAPLFPIASDFDAEMFSLCDIIIANELEAAVLSGQPSITSIEAAKAAAPIFLSLGVGTAIITLGGNGAVICSGHRDSPDVEHVETIVTTVVDTTGAGDCFVGALAYYMIRCKELTFAEKVRRACHLASLSCTKPGTQSSYPTQAEAPSYLFEP